MFIEIEKLPLFRWAAIVLLCVALYVVSVSMA